MTRINTNVSSLVAQNRLSKTNSELQTTLTRLSTGLRINSGKDDPAGLIASEALRSDITSINKAITNTQRATQIIATADSALGQVSSLLNDIRGLVVEAANTGALSDDEIAANQLQVDSSLEAINRISQTTTFQGRKLLDGSLDFVSTVNSLSAVTDSRIDQANLGASGSVSVDITIATAAAKAELTTSPLNAKAAATADTGDVKSTSFAINGETIRLTGANLTAVNFVNSAPAGAGTASLSSAGVLTITADFTATTGAVDAEVIQAALNGIDGLSATGATAAGTAAVAPSNINSGGIGAAVKGLKIDAATLGEDYNDVKIVFASGGANAADYNTTTKTLTVTVDNTEPQLASDLKTAIDGHTVNGSAPASALFTATAGSANVSFDITDGIDALNTGVTGGQVLTADVVFELVGSQGSESFNFKANSTGAQIAAAINLSSDATGVTATYSSLDNNLTFNSVDYGSAALVSVNIISEGGTGTFKSSLSSSRDIGSDIVARVNGIQADGKGNQLSINTSTLDLSLTIDPTSTASTLSFNITGGGALFQLGGDVVSNQQARLGIGSVSSSSLGGTSGRLYQLGSGQARSLSNDPNGAAKIIDEVINKVTSLRGRLGAFQATTLESNMTSLSDTVGNLTEAESSIRDADFAAESSKLTRAQILVQSGTQVLSLANQNPQNVLSLLR
jgi:flagellin